VYDRLEPARLRLAELHLRVGEALERVHADDPSRVLPELAHHFTLAVPLVEVERAVAYNLRAAEAATASAADQEGAARLSTALELGIADPRERARVQLDLAYLLGSTRRGFEADAMLAVGLEAATTLEERALAADALHQQTHHRLMADPGFDPSEAETVAKVTIETFRELGNERDLALAERRLGLAFMSQGRVEEECLALERALIHADASDDGRARQKVISSLVHALFNGPAPVVEAIGRCEVLLESSGSDRVLEATVNRGLAALVAMAGRFDEARELVRTSSLVLDELNLLTRLVYRVMAAKTKELIGDRVGAEHELTAAWQGLSGMRGDTVDARAMSAAFELAHFYCDEGRWEDAERCLDYGRDVLEIKSLIVAVGRFAASARVAAHRGEHAQALELAQRGVGLAERSDLLNLRARVWLALAEVQRTVGAEADARTAVAAALDLYEQKGNVAAAAIVRGSY
jgi:tetratricopeptide (TPR) repeat protein